NPKEDSRLFSLVEKHGARHWTMMTAKMPGRNPKECRER
ncbi:unnamed protein product, partial [Discosporangium mesarthrocarpum]